MSMSLLKENLLKLKTWIEQQLKSIGKKEKVFLCIISLFLPVFLYSYWYFWPKYRKIEELSIEIVNLKEEINKYKKLSQKKILLEKKLKERKIFLKKIIAILPNERELPELLSNVSEKAIRSGLEVISFTPRKEIVRNYYNIIPFDIEVKGGFQELILFLDKIESLTRIITLNNLFIKISKAKDGVSLYSKCTFYTYRYTGKNLNSSNEKKK